MIPRLVQNTHLKACLDVLDAAHPFIFTSRGLHMAALLCLRKKHYANI